jgi:hypothetical protein
VFHWESANLMSFAIPIEPRKVHSVIHQDLVSRALDLSIHAPPQKMPKVCIYDRKKKPDFACSFPRGGPSSAIPNRIPERHKCGTSGYASIVLQLAKKLEYYDWQKVITWWSVPPFRNCL